MSSHIPLRKTGLIVFGARIVSIFTGMLFLIMLTGWLSPTRFGLWEVIVDFVTFASFPAGLLGFWATRDIARGNLVGRTVLLLNLLLSSGGMVAYLIFSITTYSAFTSKYTPFLFALLLVPLTYWNQAASNIAVGHRPSASGYALLVSEIAKLLVAYPALFILRLEINGVILAVMVSYLVQATVLTLMVSDVTSDRLDLVSGKRWVSYSWVPALSSLPPAVAVADTFVASLATPLSTQLTGYYQAAFSIGILVSYVLFLTSALYPLLLRGGSDAVPNTILDLLLMFGIPMAVGVVVLSHPLLALLSPLYVSSGSDVSVALMILAVSSLVFAFSGFSDSILGGKETIDLDDRLDLGTYFKSRFWFMFKANIAYNLLYVGGVFVSTTIAFRAGLGIGSIVTIWASLQLVLLVPIVLIKLRRIRKDTKLIVPSSMGGYLFSSIVMAIVLYLVSTPILTPVQGRLVYGLLIVSFVAIGAGVYFGVLALVDKKVRNLESELLRSILS